MSGPVLEPSVLEDLPGWGDSREAPGFIDTLMAGARVEADRVDDVQGIRKFDAYAPLIEALVERGVDRASLHHGAPGFLGIGPAQLGMPDYERVWREAKRAGIEGLPDDRVAFERDALRRGQGRSQDQDTLARGNGVAGFVGAMAGSMRDPVNVYSLLVPGAGAGASLGRKVLVDGLINAGVESYQALAAGDNYERLGEEYGLGDAALDIVAAGVGGAAIRGGIEIAPRIDAAALDLAKPLRDAIDAKFADRDLARAFAQAVPENMRTPEQDAALHVLLREVELDETSPYVRTYEAIDAHRAKLDRATEAMAAGRLVSDGELAGAGSIMPEPINPGRVSAALAGDRADVASTLEQGGLSDPVVSGFMGNFEVEGGYGGALGDGGSASGIGQWRLERRANFRRLFGKDPHQASVAQQAKFVLWELENPQAAGMTVAQRDAILAARTPEQAAELIDRHFERSDGQHRDRRKSEARRIFGGGEGEPIWNVVDTEVRPAALDAERPRVAVEGQAVPVAQIAADDIGVDAELMQFKAGGDEFGVTDRLHGVEQWDPIAAGMVTVWEGADGRRLIADGHQRLGLAKRIQAATGQPIGLNAFVLREADGFSAIDARIITALKNIGEGTGTASDAAKIFRDLGLDADDVLRRLPPRSTLVRDGKALARLDDEAFGAVINQVIPENYGAAIGALVEDRELHMAMVRILNETDPPNRMQAEAIIRQAKEAGFTRETQDSLFGSEDLVTGLFAQRAKLLDRALKELRKMKGAFQVAVRNADTLEAGGNRIDVDASTAAAAGNAQALALVDRLALRKGNAVNELLDQAARRVATGEPIARVLRDFVGEIRKLDLNDIAREAGSARAAGDGPGGSGRAGEPQGPDDLETEQLSPREADAAAAAGDLGASLFDDTTAARFDDPAGDGVQATAESTWHDIKAAESAVQANPLEASFARWIDEDFARARQAYETLKDPELGLTSESGRVINTDLARELSPEYRADRSRSADVHEPASAFVKKLYAEKLREPVPDGLEPQVLFTAGGTGAGKSTGLRVLGDENAAIIYDTNMNTLASSVTKIEQALDAGWLVRIVYTYRDPIDALVNGALPRAERVGRTVPISAHVDTHVGARQVMDQLAERYADDPRVLLQVIDNSRGKGRAQEINLEDLPKVTKEGLHERAEAAVRQAYADGAIGRQTFRGTLGRGADAGTPDPRAGRQGVDEADRGDTQPGNGEPLDSGAATDPNIADRQRQELELAAASPMRALSGQDGVMGLGLFDQANQPKFDLDDGKGARSAAEIRAELDADRAAIEEIRKCL